MDDEGDNVVSILDGKTKRSYETTMKINSRRYGEGNCSHKGPYTIDKSLATVECGDCGALLNPMFVLEKLATREAYWNRRQKELSEYISKLNEEIKGRERTKCTHCGNMTAIRYKANPPQTWVPSTY